VKPIAWNRYENAPAMQVARNAGHVNHMLDSAKAAARVIEARAAGYISPGRIEAIATHDVW